MTRNRLITLAAGLAAAALALAGCASPSVEPSAGASTAQEANGADAQWPRTITVPAGARTEASTIVIEAEPQRIVALDYESAEVIAELGLAEHLVLVPAAVLNPALGSHVEELSDGPATFPVAMEVDAETVIAIAPDLVVMSPRHGNETPIATVLGQSGIAVLQLPDSWVSVSTLLTNIDLIGQATGSEAPATTLIASIQDGLDASAAPSSSASASASAPRVLLLTNQAGRPFVTAGDAYPVELLELAGAQNVAAELGIERTSPIAAEQFVQAAPDGIVLIDMNGTGDRMFAELLENPAVAALPAVAGGKILRIGGKQVQALGLAATVDGLAQLTEWAGTLSAQE